jgi:hypothetical protein
MHKTVVLVRLGAAVGAIAACAGKDDPVEPVQTAPRVVSAAVTPNPHNQLSVLVTFTSEQADSARVVYLGENRHRDSTPFVPAAGGTGMIVPLGLHPATVYRGVVEISSFSGRASSDTLSFATDPLPELLQRVAIRTTGTGGSGMTLTAVQLGGNAVFAIAFDSAGSIRWYRQFEGTEEIPGELKQQPNGNFTLYRGLSRGSQRVPGHYVEFAPAGDSIRAVSVAPPRYLDNHELWIRSGPDGLERLHFFTYDHRTVDLSAVGVPGQISVAGHQLLRLRPDGTTEFEWDAWDHLRIDEWIEGPYPDPGDPREPDYDHPNSLTFDRDGNYLISMRNLAQIIKVDASTGAVLWRLGGVRNEFSFVNDPLGGFSAQHTVQVLPNGNLLLYDNGTRHEPQESRAVEYALDLGARSATLVWEFRHQPPIYTPFVGLAQRLASGNTFIAYGQVGHATEVGPDGSVAWEADLSLDGRPAFVYRMVRIGSLYGYVDP